MSAKGNVWGCEGRGKIERTGFCDKQVIYESRWGLTALKDRLCEAATILNVDFEKWSGAMPRRNCAWVLVRWNTYTLLSTQYGEVMLHFRS
jgi:hypothetical protein